MSPLTVRRYRAERLLRGEFEALRGEVIAVVRRRLGATGVELDSCDLDACYAIAWQGLYAAILEGQEIANPAGWLVLVAFRRAIDESRARTRAARDGSGSSEEVGWDGERDLAEVLDDRLRLRHLFEALRGRLSTREREAAVLCYLQGLPRSEAAARMGISEARLRKLMEGVGPGRPGVAGKVGALVETIRDGAWCEEQSSLMRALAFGILDPEGERYRLALMHRSECPSCRAYVTSLRGLAAALPPLFLPGGLGAAALGDLGRGAHVGGAAVGGHGSGTVGSLSPSGAAGVGVGAGAGTGGGWMLAGAGKLAVGCAIALGVGAGCVALKVDVDRPHAPAHRTQRDVDGNHVLSRVASTGGLGDDYALVGGLAPAAHSGDAGGQPLGSASGSLTPAREASREFGPEQTAASSAQPTSSSRQDDPLAHAASAARTVTPEGDGAKASEFSSASWSASQGPQASSAAEREFSPG